MKLTLFKTSWPFWLPAPLKSGHIKHSLNIYFA